jgi:polygalacturonase
VILPSISMPAVAGTTGARHIRAARSLPADGWRDVRTFGAKGNGKTNDAAAINAAIEDAAAAGGGTVYLPAGQYLSHTIRLKSRITLHLEQGATLIAAPVPFEGATTGGYDAAEPIDPAIASFQDFGHSHWRNALI